MTAAAAFVPTGPIDHVAVAVHDLDEACARYGRLLGVEAVGRETVGAVDLAFLEVPGSTVIELIAPATPDSPVAGFLQRRGEGLHHLCFRVPDVDAALAQAVANGLPVVDICGRPGAAGSRIGFLHPDAFGGVLVELKQKPQRDSSTIA